MANKSLFQSFVGRSVPKSDARNEAGGPAYAFSPRHALAQYAVTGCLKSTFYATATAQLEKVLSLATAVDAGFVAKTAIYCRTRGYMKDMPALLCATLSARDCIDVASLVAAAVLRHNPDAEVLPFSDNVVPCKLNPRDSVMTNAQKLASLPSGGTNCSAPLRALNHKNTAADLVIVVSDNMSWVDGHGGGRSTATMQEWTKIRSRNPQARLVCLDVQPYGSTQAAEREDILNIGGFSDAVFEIISAFAAGELRPDHWVGLIDQIAL